MPLVKMDAQKSAGGGGITAYTKEGNSTDGSMSGLPTGTSQTFTITTGIPKSELTHFRFVAYFIQSNNYYYVMNDYDTTRQISKQITYATYINSGSPYVDGGAAYADLASGAASQGCVIRSITDDGVVTMQSGSRTNWGSYSYAEWQAG